MTQSMSSVPKRSNKRHRMDELEFLMQQSDKQPSQRFSKKQKESKMITEPMNNAAPEQDETVAIKRPSKNLDKIQLLLESNTFADVSSSMSSIKDVPAFILGQLVAAANHDPELSVFLTGTDEMDTTLETIKFLFADQTTSYNSSQVVQIVIASLKTDIEQLKSQSIVKENSTPAQPIPFTSIPPSSIPTTTLKEETMTMNKTPITDAVESITDVVEKNIPEQPKGLFKAAQKYRDAAAEAAGKGADVVKENMAAANEKVAEATQEFKAKVEESVAFVTAPVVGMSRTKKIIIGVGVGVAVAGAGYFAWKKFGNKVGPLNLTGGEVVESA